MHKFWVVFGQVYKKNVRSGSWLFLVISPLVFAAVAAGIVYFISQNQHTAKVAVVTDDPAVSAAIVKQSTSELKYKAQGAASAKKAFEAEKLDGILTVDPQASFKSTFLTRDNGQNVSETDLIKSLAGLKAAQTAAQLKLSPTQLQALMTPPVISTKTVGIEDGRQVAKSNTSRAVNSVVSTGAMLLIMIFTMTYGSILAQEIATEKGSRIMEILLSSVNATTQFFGKISGIFALLLTQLAVYGVAGVIGWQFLKDLRLVKSFLRSFDLSILSSATSLVILAFFLVGVMTFAVLAALTGSLVSNQEQVQQAVMPISLLGMLGYFIAIAAQGGDSVLSQVASYLPFTNAFVMPIQLSLGRVSLMQGWLSVGIGLIFLVAFTWFTVIVYKSNVLVYSGSGILQSMRASFSIWRAERGVKH